MQSDQVEFYRELACQIGLKQSLVTELMRPVQLHAQVNFLTDRYLQWLQQRVPQFNKLLKPRQPQTEQQSSEQEPSEDNAEQEQGESLSPQKQEQDSNEQQEEDEQQQADPQVLQQFAQLEKEFRLGARPDQQVEPDGLQDQFQQFRQTIDPQLQDQIQQLQDKLVGKKSWQLKGEVRATQRPKNSILETQLDYKQVSSGFKDMAPERSTSIEQMIKRRVLDNLWDDRKRVSQFHLKENFKNFAQINTAKDTRGLADLYAQDFAKKVGIKKGDDPIKDQIMNLFSEVSYKIDALTNFNFRPRVSQAVIVQPKNGLVFKEQALGLANAKQKQKVQLLSQKQIKKLSTRNKTKRIMRQRKKERMRKSQNRLIQFSGLKKHEFQMKKKIKKNSTENERLSRSTNFFKKMQDIQKS